ncbi:hypothetical protein QVD17_05766 [Tagetes erecta]|uniref:Uncharacterized protein n=1 Tax=Tagetes erecta TaxID=13708 RepID=A0AAD8LIX3_TARER|nr:hypothetical protein QVD17_05766 [Tagetes erecta]
MRRTLNGFPDAMHHDFCRYRFALSETMKYYPPKTVCININKGQSVTPALILSLPLFLSNFLSLSLNL